MASMFNCQCCEQEFPTVLREIHHRFPREYGCPPYLDDIDHPENLLDLCEHCHSLIHKAASWGFKGKSAEGLLQQVYLGKAYAATAIANTLTFAQTILEAERHRQDSGGEVHRENSKIMLDLNFEFYNLEVKSAAKASGTTVARFMADAIIQRTIMVNGQGARHALERVTSGESLASQRIKPPQRRK